MGIIYTIMGLRCELCDDWLNIFQISRLCETCYKTRTIVKAYTALQILEKLQEFFLIEDEEVPNLVGGDDQRDYDKPITRSNKKIYGDKKKEEVKVI